MKRLQGETDFAQLHLVVLLRLVVPRNRLHLRQIKRELVAERRVRAERRIAEGENEAWGRERGSGGEREKEIRRDVNPLSMRFAHPESEDELLLVLYQPSRPPFRHPAPFNDVVLRQIQRRGFPVRWKVGRLARPRRRVLPINASSFFRPQLSFFFFFFPT